jgi:ribonuclease P protein component
MFREIFRRSLREIPEQFDIVINAKYGCAGIDYRELRAEFLNATKKFFR